jgi:cell division initiation protein
MKITPLEIEQHDFIAQLWGYSRNEVRDTLKKASESLEEAILENNRLKDRIIQLENEVENHRVREKLLNDTLLQAQKICEEIVQNARKEADIIISDAQLTSEKIVKSAHEKIIRLSDEIRDLKREKITLLSELKGTLETHYRLIETMLESSSGEKEEGRFALLKT